MEPNWVDELNPKDSASYRIHLAKVAGDQQQADQILQITIQEMVDTLFAALGRFHTADISIVLAALSCTTDALRKAASPTAVLVSDMYLQKVVSMVILPFGTDK